MMPLDENIAWNLKGRRMANYDRREKVFTFSSRYYKLDELPHFIIELTNFLKYVEKLEEGGGKKSG